jgi:hypothetical protein
MNKLEMFRLHLDGHSYADIGEQAGVTRQYVHQVLSPPRPIRSHVVTKAVGLCAGCGLYVGDLGHVHQPGATGVDDYSGIDYLTLLCGSCHRQSHVPVAVTK